MKKIIVGIKNSGNEALESACFEKAIEVDFGNASSALAAEIVRTEPEHLLPKIEVQENRVLIQPLLLNAGDTVVLSVIGENMRPPSCLTRIAGVRGIEQASKTWHSSAGTMFFDLFGGVTFLLMLEEMLRKSALSQFYVPTLTFAVAFMCALITWHYMNIIANERRYIPGLAEKSKSLFALNRSKSRVRRSLEALMLMIVTPMWIWGVVIEAREFITMLVSGSLWDTIVRFANLVGLLMCSVLVAGLWFMIFPPSSDEISEAAH